MYQAGTQSLIDIWAALPRTGRFPLQSAFDPTALGTLLPHALVAQTSEAGVTLRLAGSWIERLHGRSLKGARWLDLWAQDSRLMIHRSTSQALLEARPVVIQALAGPGLEPLEIVLAPMKGPTGAPDRLIGLYQGTRAEALRDVRELTARLAAPVADLPLRPAPTLAAVDGRRIA